MDVYSEQKKQFDTFIDIVLAYAKANGFAYILSVGKYCKDVDKTIIMDSFYEQDNCAFHAMTQMLVQPGPIAINLAMSMMTAGKEAAERKIH